MSVSDAREGLERPMTVMLVGVGGQGTITAADLLARAAMNDGYDVKVSEIHGMAQRGGSVSTTVRFGRKVDSMVLGAEGADVIISFELVEALRALPQLARGGRVVANDVAIEPMSVLAGMAEMPRDPRGLLEGALGERALVLDALGVATRAGNPKCANVALLAGAAGLLPLTREAWTRAIEGRVPPKTLAANLAAFDAVYNQEA